MTWLLEPSSACELGQRVADMAERVTVAHACSPGAAGVLKVRIGGKPFEVFVRVPREDAG